TDFKNPSKDKLQEGVVDASRARFRLPIASAAARSTTRPQLREVISSDSEIRRDPLVNVLAL
ncbi:MAG TPA: hypothetical protein VIA80_17000, partial [Hyphomonadaceae bacterium]